MGAATIARCRAPLTIILMQRPVGSSQELLWPSNTGLQVVAADVHPFGRRQDRVRRRFTTVLVGKLIKILTKRGNQAQKEQQRAETQHGHGRKRKHIQTLLIYGSSLSGGSRRWCTKTARNIWLGSRTNAIARKETTAERHHPSTYSVVSVIADCFDKRGA